MSNPVGLYLIGIVFQYFSIAPMRGLGLKDGLVAAVKADTLSIAAYEIGIFVWMALVYFVLFTSAPGAEPADVLVHDADRHDRRLRDGVPDEPVAH